MKQPITSAQAMSHPVVVETVNALGEMADELRAEVEALTKERDEYQRAADDMAMAHKIERDALLLANLDLKNWFDAIKFDYDALAAAAKLAHAYIEWSANGNWRASDGQIPTAEEVIAALKQAGMK